MKNPFTKIGEGMPVPSPTEPPLEGTSATGAGVTGASISGDGIFGYSQEGTGISGVSAPLPASGVVAIDALLQPASSGDGVYGEGNNGVRGVAQHLSGTGVLGENLISLATGNPGPGVAGNSKDGTGVAGTSERGSGVTGASEDGPGLSGTSTNGPGVTGSSRSGPGVMATGNGAGAALLGSNADTSGWAGLFVGNVEVRAGSLTATTGPARFGVVNASAVLVSGELSANDVVLTGADCAEDFDAPGEDLEPGTVVVLDGYGSVSRSSSPYSKKVAGVISGAGAYRPAVVMDRRRSPVRRAPVALMGKVFCKVDASYGPIDVGDLLTTSPSPGFAMKATDPGKAFGAVIGKALEALAEGAGLIPILVALQ